MKTFKYITLILLTALSLTACSDDDDAGSVTMNVNKVFLEDAKSSVTDREVTFARLGQLIRIEGSGFTGLKKIYINGYDTYFNNALLTDNNIWVSLNTATPVVGTADSIRNTILLVKDNTSYSYSFIIRSSSPSVSSISNTLPMAGEKVVVNGNNLQETSKVTLPGDIVITDGIESDANGKWYSFTMPANAKETGSITSEGANGTAMTAANFNDNRCYIINFDGLGVLGSWSATNHATDLVDDPLNSGRGKVAMLITQNRLDTVGAVKANTASIPGTWTAGNGEATDDWNRMTSVIPSTTPVSELALQFDVYCPNAWDGTGQMEITLQNNLSNYGWNSACTKYSDSYTNQACVWIPWMNRETGADIGPYQTTSWKTVTIPLTWFGNYSQEGYTGTFGDLIADRNNGSYRNFGFTFCNSDIDFDGDASTTSDIITSKDCSVKIYVDNFRIVSNVAQSVSDYPDEE